MGKNIYCLLFYIIINWNFESSLQVTNDASWCSEKDGSCLHTDDIGKVADKLMVQSNRRSKPPKISIEWPCEDLSPDERQDLIDIAAAVERSSGNPFLENTYENEPSYRAFLREKRAPSEGFIPEHDADLHEKSLHLDDDDDDIPDVEELEATNRKSGQEFAGSVSDYCDRYEQNFAVYCVGDVDEHDENSAIIAKFCPAYRNSCKSKSIVTTNEGGGSIGTPRPSNPFAIPKPDFSASSSTSTSEGNGGSVDKVFGSFASDADKQAVREGIASKKSGHHSHHSSHGHHHHHHHHRKHKKIGDPRSPFIHDEFDLEEEDTNIYYNELKKRFPCKPDCDPRIFPHCTASCKCDYIYPYVQRFCNPPPLPLFLNTCRLWYNGCPKYEGYHYASQFVYSKAEKGKALPVAVNPYNIPTPAIGRKKRAANDEMTPWGATEAELLQSAKLNGVSNERAFDQPIPNEQQPPVEGRHHKNLVETENEEQRQYQRNLLHDRLNAMKIQEKQKALAATRHVQPTEQVNSFIPKVSRDEKMRELWKTLKAVNSLTASGVVDRDQSESFNGLHRNKDPGAKAHQGSIPIVPSDASYGSNSGGGGDNTFHNFDGLTDSRGILHRPRSRSPFTKPGLWEPNPDNPHNRDHANKYWYHPESVAVDWLNGQLAWGAHWAVPAAGVGGTDGFSAVHFPSIGTFLNIPDDYD